MGDFNQINDDDSELLAGGKFFTHSHCNGSKIDYIKNRIQAKVAFIKSKLQEKYGN